MLERWQQVFRALGQDVRLKLYLTLTTGRFCVCQLEQAFNVSQPAISQHLRVLREAGLVKAERQAQWVFYTADPATLHDVLRDLLDVEAGPAVSEIREIRDIAAAVSIEGCTLNQEALPN